MLGRFGADIVTVGVATKYAATRWRDPHQVLIWIAPKIYTGSTARLVAKPAALVEAHVTAAGRHTVLLPFAPKACGKQEEEQSLAR